MKLGSLAAILTGTLTLSQAMAFPLAAVNAFQCDQQISYEQSMQNHFIHVNQIGKVEKRRGLSKMKMQLEAAGFTEDDITRAETCGGIVYCPAADGEPQNYGSVVSLVDSKYVYSASHIFFHEDAEGHASYLKSRAALAGCYFFNYAHPTDHIPIVISDEQRDKLNSLDLSENSIDSLRGEGIKISLKRQIPGCSPFPVDKADQPLQSGDVVLSIGAPTADINPRPSGREPVGQFCKIRGDDPAPGLATVYYTDCSSSNGESGSVQFIRRSIRLNGRVRYEWVAKSITATSGTSRLNGDDFNLATGSYTATVGIEGDHLRDVLNEKGSVPVEHMAEATGI